jgi:O-antigen/teichoic acid export membrane protein
MILAHILSQCILIGYLGSRVLSVRDLRAIAATPLRGVFAMAKKEYKFPLFDLPATATGYAIINLPAVMIGSLFGAAFAGYFGVAARLVTGPVTLTATPLSNVLVAEANRAPHDAHLRRSGHGLLLVAVAVIAIPALGFGLVAPYIVTPLLGEEWHVTGRIMTALAVMAAAQAVSTPLQDVPTLTRRQEVRLLIDVVRAALVFGPLLFGFQAGWDPLSVIYLMAAGGTAGYALRTVASLILLNRMVADSQAGASASSQIT